MTTVRESINTQVIDQHNYSARGNPNIGGSAGAYGGQLIGQALTSAFNSIQDLDSTFQLKSLHCYFVNPTPYDQDIFYKVHRIKSGKSFCSLTVEATQTDGRVTFKCMLSLDKPEPEAINVIDFTTRHPMPRVPHPDNPSAPVDYDNRHLVHLTHSAFSTVLDIYSCSTKREYENFVARKPTEPRYVFWIRAKDAGYTARDHQNYHRAVIAFMSDFLMAGCIRNAFPDVKMSKVTSLDHSIWFHTDCNSQDWHLYVNECDHCKGGRALNLLRIYKEDGTLVATCSQESLCRPKL